MRAMPVIKRELMVVTIDGAGSMTVSSIFKKFEMPY
jgi:hypothetical protein